MAHFFATNVVDVYIVNLSFDWGISTKAFRTFEDAWAAAAEALREQGLKVIHKSAAECFDAFAGNDPLLCDRWRVGYSKELCSTCNSSAVGPAMIFKTELEL